MRKKDDSLWYKLTDEDDNPFDDKKNPYAKGYPEPESRDYIEENDYEFEDTAKCVLDSPILINEYLQKKVIGQPLATKQCALFLYNHLHRHNKKCRCMALVGPTGSGKTYIWECAEQLLRECGCSTEVVFVDASKITPAGFIGDSAHTFLWSLKENQDYIIVLDEFDKLIAKSNVRDFGTVLTEFLAMMNPGEHEYLTLNPSPNQREDRKRIKVGSFSWIVAGAFSDLAEDIADKTKTSGIGFGAVSTKEEAYTKELTLQDIIDFGMPAEMAGRIGSVVNVRPITKEQFEYLIVKSENSPITVLEEIFELPLGYVTDVIVTDKRLAELIDDCYEKKLGVRAVYSQLQNIINDFIYDNFDVYEYLLKQRRREVEGYA